MAIAILKKIDKLVSRNKFLYKPKIQNIGIAKLIDIKAVDK